MMGRSFSSSFSGWKNSQVPCLLIFRSVQKICAIFMFEPHDFITNSQMEFEWVPLCRFGNSPPSPVVSLHRIQCETKTSGSLHPQKPWIPWWFGKGELLLKKRHFWGGYLYFLGCTLDWETSELNHTESKKMVGFSDPSTVSPIRNYHFGI